MPDELWIIFTVSDSPFFTHPSFTLKLSISGELEETTVFISLHYKNYNKIELS